MVLGVPAPMRTTMLIDTAGITASITKTISGAMETAKPMLEDLMKKGASMLLILGFTVLLFDDRWRCSKGVKFSFL